MGKPEGVLTPISNTSKCDKEQKLYDVEQRIGVRRRSCCEDDLRIKCKNTRLFQQLLYGYYFILVRYFFYDF